MTDHLCHDCGAPMGDRKSTALYCWECMKQRRKEYNRRAAKRFAERRQSPPAADKRCQACRYFGGECNRELPLMDGKHIVCR